MKEKKRRMNENYERKYARNNKVKGQTSRIYYTKRNI